MASAPLTSVSVKRAHKNHEPKQEAAASQPYAISDVNASTVQEAEGAVSCQLQNLMYKVDLCIIW